VSRITFSILTVGLLSAATACASATRPVALPGAGDVTITTGAVRALEARWDRVELGSSVSATCPGTTGPPPVHLSGDFNGDGTEDVILWVTTAGTPRLVALFARLDGEYTAVEVGDTASVASGVLELGRRSTSYQLASLTVDSYFGLDTVVLRTCDGARTAWFWTGGTFEAQPLAK
jgi:hypothetical protein